MKINAHEYKEITTPVWVEESVGATHDVESCRTSYEILVSTEHALYVGRRRGGGAGSRLAAGCHGAARGDCRGGETRWACTMIMNVEVLVLAGGVHKLTTGNEIVINFLY